MTVGYTRAESTHDAEFARLAMMNRCGEAAAQFHCDVVSGQRELARALRSLKAGDVLMVRYLSDLSLGLNGLLRTAHNLVKREVTIFVLESGLRCGPGTESASFLESAIGAHGHYWRRNIRLGMAAVRQAGGNVGRPRKEKTT